MSVLGIERDGAVVRLILNRPTNGNAIDLEMVEALLDAANACDEDDAIRCVVLTGTGRFFCTGGDVAAMAAGGDLGPLIKKMTARLHMAIARFARMNKPLVTLVNGPAAGAGMSLAILGDIVLAAKSSHFTLGYSSIGFTPDAGATWLLPRLIGLRQTQKLMLRKSRIDAPEAERIGLVTEIVEDAMLESAGAALARELAASAPSAVGPIRSLLLSSFGASLETQMEMEARTVVQAAKSRHGQEGMAAFLAKRSPDFTK